MPLPTSRQTELAALAARYQRTRDPRLLGDLYDRTAPALYRLALVLSPDAQHAEDALQETFLAAFDAMKRFDTARPIEPWLAGILRNKIKRQLERRARGMRRGPPAMRDDAAQPLEEHLQVDGAELATGALEDLPDTLRPAAVLHWRYGLSPAAIGHALGIPPSTVRSHLTRARARLRGDRRLLALGPVSFGSDAGRGLGALRVDVLQAAGTAAGVAIAGGMVMTKKVSAAVAIVILLAAAAISGTALWLETSRSSDVNESAHDETDLVGPTPELVGRERATRSNMSEPEVRHAHALLGRVVTSRGEPIVNARVDVLPLDLAAVASLDDLSELRGVGWVAESGADGRFEVALDDGVEVVQVSARAPGFGRVRPTAARVGTEAVVVLHAAASIGGRVLDLEERPVAGAHLTLRITYDTGARLVVSTRAENDGTWQMDGLPALAHAGGDGSTMPTLEVRAAGFASVLLGNRSFQPPVLPDLRPGQQSRLDVYLDRGRTMNGRVLNAATDEPISAATVVLLSGHTNMLTAGRFAAPPRTLGMATTDREGRFTLRNVPSDAMYADRLVPRGHLGYTVAWADGYTMEAELLGPDRPERPLATTIRLLPATYVEGRVLAADGPVAGAAVSAVGGDRSRTRGTWRWQIRKLRLEGQPPPSLEAITDSEGRYRVALRLESASERDLTVNARTPSRGRTRARGSLAVAVAAHEVNRVGDIHLRDVAGPKEVARVRFRVRDEGGEPVAGATITSAWDHAGRSAARTDRDGLAALPRRQLRPMRGASVTLVRIDALGFARAVAIVPPDGDPDDVTLERERVLRGRVTYADGTPVEAGWVVAAAPEAKPDSAFPLGNNRIGGPILTAEPPYLQRLGHARVAHDGTFSIRGLPQGTCLVAARVTGQAGRFEMLSVLGQVVAPRVATDEQDLELVLERPPRRARARVTGQALDEFAVPLLGFEALLQQGALRLRARVVGPGRFEFARVARGTWTLSITAPGYGTLERTVNVAGEESVTLDPATLVGGSAIAGRLVSDDEIRLEGRRVALRRRPARGGRLPPATIVRNGDFAFEAVGPGVYDLVVLADHGRARPELISTAPISVDPGDRTDISVRVAPVCRLVVDVRGLPLGARMEVRDAEERLIAVRHRDRHVASEELRLAPGAYSVCATGFEEERMRVDLVAGRTTRVAVRVSR